MSSITHGPYRPARLRATFETWVLPSPRKRDIVETFIPPAQHEDRAIKDTRLAKQIPGIFQLEIRTRELGRRTVYQAMVGQTLQPFDRVFALSALDECKRFVASQFKKQVTDWEEC